MQILQAFFLQDFQDLALNIARKHSKIIFLQDLILQEKFHYSARLARYVQDFMHDLASLARKILARFANFLQDNFYWD